MPTLISALLLPSHTHPIPLCLTTPSMHPMSRPLPHHPNLPSCQSRSILLPPQQSLLTPHSHLKWRLTSSPANPTLTRLSEPLPMDSSRPSTIGRSSMPYSLRAYRTPTWPYRTVSRTSNARLTVASSSPSVPLGMRTTTGESPHRSLSEEGTTLTPSGSSSTTMAASTSSSGRTLTRSPTPLTSSSTHLTWMQSLHHSLAGSATYSLVPLPPTMPYARQYLILTTGMLLQRWNATTATTTTTTTSPTNSRNSSASSPLSTMPSLPPTTGWKWHKFLLLFLTSRDAPSPSPTQDIALLTNITAMAALVTHGLWYVFLSALW